MTDRETALASHAKENPIVTGFTAAPALTEPRAGQQALDTHRASTLRAGERRTPGPEGITLPAPEGAPTAVPGGGHALLPPPAKGPGSAGSVTLTGWFLIFLARFFSRAPDISGGVAEPVRSGQRRGGLGRRWRCRSSRSPRHQPQPGAHSRRGLHQHTCTSTPRHSACALLRHSPEGLHFPEAPAGDGWALRGGRAGGETSVLVQFLHRFQPWPRS